MSNQELRELEKRLLRVLRESAQPLDAAMLCRKVTSSSAWASTATADVLSAAWNLVDQGKAVFAQGRKLKAAQPSGQR